MAITDPEHKEEEESAADDADTGAQVAPINTWSVSMILHNFSKSISTNYL